MLLKIFRRLYDCSLRRLRTEVEADIGHLRTEVDTGRQHITTIEKQVKEQLEQLAQRSANEDQMFKERLEQLVKQFESESQQIIESKSQTFMEASYNFTLGKNAYKIGDNIHALEYFSQALQLQPKNIRVMERLGRTYSNLNKMKQAVYYLQEALKVDPSNEAALRSLALCYRYTDKEKAIEYLNRCVEVNPLAYEALDFLGLLYRDQELIDDAISVHERALMIKKRPETEFYLSILYALKGDKIRAKLMALTAYDDTRKQEHDQRIRLVWKILIQCGVYIMDGEKAEALQHIRALAKYITTKPIYDAVTGHLHHLLTATNHKDWISEFMEIVKFKEM